MSDLKIGRETICDQLRSAGLQEGDRAVLHSSLRTIGGARELVRLPNCGADAVIDAFLDVVGPGGLLCLPTFTKTFVNPAAGPVGEPFDPAVTPSRVGSITNVALARPGRSRSLHPTHSWAAIGARAAELVEGHEKTSTFGRDSICGRMYDWDFKIVWLGTTGTTNTSTHFAEDWLDLPNMSSEDALVKDGDGFRKVTVYKSPSGPRDFYRNGCKLDAMLEKWNIQTVGRVHSATVKVMRHRAFMNRLLNAMIDDPCLLLFDGKDDAYHARFYHLNVAHMDRMKKRLGGAAGILSALGCRSE